MATIVSFSEFKFDSLRKFMLPIYSDLLRNAYMPKEQKPVFAKMIAHQFCVRLRIYRGFTLEEVVERSKDQFSISDLVDFENGESKTKELAQEIKWFYEKIFRATPEMHYLDSQIHAFFNPSVRESEILMAKEVLIKHGIKSDYVNYKDLWKEKGKLLELKR